jgi:hypothetical protein
MVDPVQGGQSNWGLSDPPGAQQGDFYFNVSTGKFRWFNNGSWADIVGSSDINLNSFKLIASTNGAYLTTSSNTGWSVYSQANGVRTGFDLGPTRGTLPVSGGLTDFVQYRTVDQVTNFQRFNIDQDTDGTLHFGEEINGNLNYFDVVWNQESSGNSANRVTAGTEVIFKLAESARVGGLGGSTPIAINYGHLRFDVASMGGNANTYYMARGGGSTLASNVPSGAVLQFSVNNVIALEVAAGGIDRYNNIATAGTGVPAIYGSYSTTGNTGAVSNAINFTPQGVASRYRLSWSIDVTTATSHNFHLVGTWKDASGIARSQTLGGSDPAGNALVAGAITNAIGAGVYYGSVVFSIDNSATAITISTAGTFTTTVYNFDAILQQLA